MKSKPRPPEDVNFLYPCHKRVNAQNEKWRKWITEADLVDSIDNFSGWCGGDDDWHGCHGVPSSSFKDLSNAIKKLLKGESHEELPKSKT